MLNCITTKQMTSSSNIVACLGGMLNCITTKQRELALNERERLGGMLNCITTKLIHQLPVFSTGFGRYVIGNTISYRVRNSIMSDSK